MALHASPFMQEGLDGCIYFVVGFDPYDWLTLVSDGEYETIAEEDVADAMSRWMADHDNHATDRIEDDVREFLVNANWIRSDAHGLA